MKTKNINFGWVIVFLLLPIQLISQERETDSLDYYISIALENNPKTKAQKLMYEAYLQKAPQERGFGDLEFLAEFYPQPMEIIGGRSIANFGLMQQFDWFGSQKSAKIEAGYQAEAQFQLYQSEMDELILQVYEQWYEMQKIKEQIRIGEEHLLLLKHLEELSLTNYSTSSSNLSVTLRIQLEQTELENTLESLKAYLLTEKARFNVLLNRDGYHKINLDSSLEKSMFLFDVEEVLENINHNNPDLKSIENEILAYKTKADKDRKMSYPTFGVGLQYMLIGKTKEELFQMGNMNGRDMVMPMISVSLPIFRKKYNAQQKESVLLQHATTEKRNNTLNDLKSELYYLKNQLEDTERMITLYEKQTELAKTTYQLILQEFSSGKSDLTDVIQIQRQLLDYQLNIVEAIANYNLMVVSIKKLRSFNKN